MVKRLYRSSTERMLGGVCGGLGEYFNVDPTLVRLGFVVAALTTGIGFLAYPIMWMGLGDGVVAVAAAGIGFLAYPIMWIVVPGRPATDSYRRVEGPKEPTDD
ncbi:MAG TPA: PspC domain-containing protein [Chloroflexota bacterium]|nr:PspC domain-containing protein [Chloroflexota bacterium]